MWIGVLFILAGGVYLAWCLVVGKVLVTLGTDLHKKTRLVDRETSPRTFWIGWVVSAGALILFSVFFIRTVLS